MKEAWTRGHFFVTGPYSCACPCNPGLVDCQTERNMAGARLNSTPPSAILSFFCLPLQPTSNHLAASRLLIGPDEAGLASVHAEHVLWTPALISALWRAWRVALRTSLDPMSELKASRYVLPTSRDWCDTAASRPLSGAGQSRPGSWWQLRQRWVRHSCKGRSASGGGKTPSIQASGSMSLTASGTSQRKGARAKQQVGLFCGLCNFANLLLSVACKPCLGGTPRRDVKLDERTSHAPVRKNRRRGKLVHRLFVPVESALVAGAQNSAPRGTACRERQESLHSFSGIGISNFGRGKATRCILRSWLFLLSRDLRGTNLAAKLAKAAEQSSHAV